VLCREHSIHKFLGSAKGSTGINCLAPSTLGHSIHKFLGSAKGTKGINSLLEFLVMGIRQLELLVKERCQSGTLTMEDALHLFHRLLATKNPAPSIYPINHLFTALVRMKNSSSHYATIFSLFNRLTQTKGVSPAPNVYTYSVLISYCTQMKQLGLGWIFFGRFLKVGQRADAPIFSPILKGLCSECRIREAVVLLLDKMSRFGCACNVNSYSIVIDGLCKIGAISKAFGLLDIILSEGVAPNVFTYNSLIDGLCK
jgi:pentatricopeptide repeat protein